MNPKTVKPTNLTANLLSCETITVNGQTLDGTVSDIVANYGTSTSGSTRIYGQVYSNTLEVATLAKQFYLKTSSISPKTGTTITISGKFGTSRTPLLPTNCKLTIISSDPNLTFLLQNSTYTTTQSLVQFLLPNITGSSSYSSLLIGKNSTTANSVEFIYFPTTTATPYLVIGNSFSYRAQIYQTYTNLIGLRINDIPVPYSSISSSISNSSSSPSTITVPSYTNNVEIQLNKLVANRSTTASSPIVSLQLSDTSTFPNATWKYYGSGQASYTLFPGGSNVLYPDRNGNNIGIPIYHRDLNTGTTLNANGVLTLTKHSEDGVEKGWHAYIRMYCANSNDRWFFVGYVENPSTKILSRIKINLYQWNSPTVYTLSNLNYKITFY